MPASKSAAPHGLPATLMLIAIAAIATGCLKAEIVLTIASDGTANGTAVLAYDKAFMESNNITEETTLESLTEELEDEGGPAFECEPWEDDDFYGVECTVEDATLEELSEEVVMGNELSFTTDEEDGTFQVSGEVDLRDVEPEGEGLDNFDASLQVEFPGLLQEQTDGEGTEKTVTWQFELGSRTQVMAVALGGGGGPPWLLIGGVIGVLVVFGIVVGVVLFLRRRSSTPPVPPAPSASEPA